MATRVLIVDDESSILSSTAALLRGLDFDVATCSDAARILDALDRVEPDVLLQDVRMPGLDLETLVPRIRAHPRWRRLPIVLFSAGMDLEEVAARVGARAALPKPFRPHELVHAIESVLGLPA